jgi:hypothetical protein
MYMYTNIQIIYIGSYQEVELQIYSSCEQQNYANNLRTNLVYTCWNALLQKHLKMNLNRMFTNQTTSLWP